jgi:drug/metabolite transporter (DMT)-like permease
LGELTALGAALMWALTSVFFTLAGRAVGSAVVNRVRLVMGLVLLALTHLVLIGELVPMGAAPERWFWLSISGVIGLVIGDALLFQAFVLIGARLSMLLMALVPVISTLVAWFALGEHLRLIELLAIVITIGGIAWVVLERGAPRQIRMDRVYLKGLLVGFGGACGQALGLVASKQGLMGDFPVLSGVLMRMLAAVVVIWMWAALRGEARASLKALQDRRVLRDIFGGSFVGPYVGVWLSLIAVRLAPVGIASTLMALAPVLLLPLDRWVFGQRVTWRAVLGTCVAMVGVAMIFLS